MSRLTAVPISFYPSGSTPTLLSTSASSWAWTSWSEIITSAAANTYLAAVEVYCSVGQVQFEVEVGIGALGVESGLHRFRSRFTGADSNHGLVEAPLPLGGITAADRVSIRVRCSNPAATDFRVGLMVYEGLTDTTHVTTAMMRSVPDGANAVSITPSSTAWQYSSWVELTPGISNEISVLGIVPSAPISTVEYEYELGYGANPNEVGFATIRTSNAQLETGGMRTFYLPVPRPISASTRLSVRLRKSGTSTTSHNCALVYLDNTNVMGVPVTVFETITVTDVVTKQLTADIFKTVFETITVAEGLTVRPGTLLVSVSEAVGVSDDASLPLGTVLSDRIFVREYVALAPNTLAVRVSEAISIAESPLYQGSNGVAGHVGPEPGAPTGTTGLTDYWLAGI